MSVLPELDWGSTSLGVRITSVSSSRTSTVAALLRRVDLLQLETRFLRFVAITRLSCFVVKDGPTHGIVCVFSPVNFMLPIYLKWWLFFKMVTFLQDGGIGFSLAWVSPVYDTGTSAYGTYILQVWEGTFVLG